MGRGSSRPARKLKELNLVLIGSHSAGKNTVGNLIFGGRYFSYWTSWSRTCVEKYRKVDDCLITIVRTPGWYNLKESEKKTKDQIEKSLFPDGTDAFLLVISIKSKTFDGSEQEMLESLLTASVWDHTVVVFTKGDTLNKRGITIEQHIKPDFTELIQKCGGRYVVLYSGTGAAYYKQGNKITNAVERMKQSNNYPRYQVETITEEQSRTTESATSLDADDDNEDDDKICLLEKQIQEKADELKRLEAERDLHKQRKNRIPKEKKKKKEKKNKEPVAEETEMTALSKSQGPVSTTDGMNTPEQGQIDRGEWMKTLSDIMQKLSDDNFKRLKHYFKSIDERIPAAEIENKERHDMADLLVRYFRVNGSVTKTRDALKYIPHLDLQDTLKPYLSKLGEPW